MTMMTLTINQKPDDAMQRDGYKSSKDDNDDTNNQTRMMQCNMMDTSSKDDGDDTYNQTRMMQCNVMDTNGGETCSRDPVVGGTSARPLQWSRW